MLELKMCYILNNYTMKKVFMTKLVIRCGKNLHLLKKQKLKEDLTTESKFLSIKKDESMINVRSYILQK